MEKLGLAAALFLAFLAGAIVTAGNFLPIVNAGLRMEATRVVLSDTGGRFVDVYRDRRAQPQQRQSRTVPADLYYRPLQRPGRHEDCGLVPAGKIYRWSCGPHTLGRTY